MTFTIDRSNWTRVRFGDVVRKSKEKVNPTLGEVEYYVAGEHMETDNLHIDNKGIIGDGYLGPAFHMRFHPGHVLYGSRRTYLRKVAYADFDGVCANTTFVLETADDSKLAGRLLPFVMQAEPFHEHAIAVSKGSTNPYVNWPDIAAYEFLLPPIEEQHRIADVLWQFEQTLESLSEAEQIVSSSRETAFESLIRELDVPLVDLRQLLSYSTVGVVVKPTSLYTDSPDGVPALRGRDIRPGVVDTSQCVRFDREKEKTVSKSRLQLDDVVVVRSGRPGDAARISEENVGMNCIDLLLLRPSSALLGEFLELCLNSTFCRKQTAILSGGSAQQHLNLGNIRSFKIPNVSLSQQNSMVESVTRFKSLQAIIHQEILDTQGLKNSLMLQLLGGSDVH